MPQREILPDMAWHFDFVNTSLKLTHPWTLNCSDLELHIMRLPDVLNVLWEVKNTFWKIALDDLVWPWPHFDPLWYLECFLGAWEVKKYTFNYYHKTLRGMDQWPSKTGNWQSTKFGHFYPNTGVRITLLSLTDTNISQLYWLFEILFIIISKYSISGCSCSFSAGFRENLVIEFKYICQDPSHW